MPHQEPSSTSLETIIFVKICFKRAGSLILRFKKMGLSFSRLTSAIRVNVILRWQVSKETGSASLGAITIKFRFIN